MRAVPFLALCLGLFSFFPAVAQQKTKTVQRCATMKRLQLYQDNYAATRIQSGGPTRNGDSRENQGTFRLQNEITIPVVVHIVLPNPYIVTDADVQAQIDRLNLDFSGLNPDSANATNFYSVRGHSNIRFSLARRTPAGQLTNGIERRSSLTGSDIDKMQDPIKYTSLGGLDAWNTANFLNLWVGIDITGEGILGYADNIGPGTGTSDGVVLNIEAFGSSPCYTKAPYNRGRTATHELGHFFGLYHIWGDDNDGCTGDDFTQLPASTGVILPTGLYNPPGQANGTLDIGDTPNQGNASGNCISGIQTDGCSGVAPGKMYQNHMDYTYDACLTLFTKKQVARMEWILDNARSGYKNSLGSQPPANAPLLDVAPLASVSPGGFELTACGTTSYPDTLSCPGTIVPKFRVVNNGLTTITSLTVAYSLNNGTAVTQTVSVNIPSGGFYVATFPAVAVVTGNNSFRFFTTSPNGGMDAVPANDNLTKVLTVLAPISAPVSEGFETTPQNWTIDNPDLDFTWTRTTPGRNGSAGKLSIDNYNFDGIDKKDDLRSAAITVDPGSNYFLNFDLAHKNYPDAEYYDSLSVLLSTDCGQTFSRIYYKYGQALATAGSSDEEYRNPSAADWRTESITLSGNQVASGKIVLVFRNSSRYGNFIHLDNINLVKVGARDLRVNLIPSPAAAACTGQIAPAVTVENVGTETVTSFRVGYRIDNGAIQQQTFTQNLAPGATTTVSLPISSTGIGQHTFTAFSFDPVTVSGTGDTRVSNDTLQKTFSVLQPLSTPFFEGFETGFPPSGWQIGNANNNVTWVRKAPGRNSTYSIFFDNYNNNVTGETDELRTPLLNVTDADSVIVSFDVAHKNLAGQSGGSNDALAVLATADCFSSFSVVYNKSGVQLATAGNQESEFTTPVAGDWRTERIVIPATAFASGRLSLSFRNTNDFGNNIFIDNINVTAVYKRDLELVSIQQPGLFVCNPTVTPMIRVRNRGTDTVKAFTLVYNINGGASVQQTFNNLSIAKGAEATVTLTALPALAPGSYSFQINATNLVTGKGVNDSNLSNDTLQKRFAVAGNATAPQTEAFTTAVFPPSNWSVLNGDGGVTWQYNINGNGNTGSAFLNTFRYNSLGEKDDLVSPAYSFGNADSVKLRFDLAAALSSQTVTVPVDTLEVLVTQDCGNSFISVYKKWGAALQTVTAPGANEFFPLSAADWRKETIDLSAFVGQNPVIVFFRATNNNENNIFLDNIQVDTQVLPAKLKESGVLVYPAPFATHFTVWHYQTPTALQSIRVLNMAGQTVWLKQYTGNADRQEVVNLAGGASGMYLVEVTYNDGKKTVTQKILKQ
ncbi:T9SS type A sorting domain-containing protein [Flavisolibacter sp. BT320]|nr:T9SS type A sorting domain-containing protein [Flavisolibacter longurius]